MKSLKQLLISEEEATFLRNVKRLTDERALAQLATWWIRLNKKEWPKELETLLPFPPNAPGRKCAELQQFALSSFGERLIREDEHYLDLRWRAAGNATKTMIQRAKAELAGYGLRRPRTEG